MGGLAQGRLQNQINNIVRRKPYVWLSGAARLSVGCWPVEKQNARRHQVFSRMLRNRIGVKEKKRRAGGSPASRLDAIRPSIRQACGDGLRRKILRRHGDETQGKFGVSPRRAGGRKSLPGYRNFVIQAFL
jgi:hypothetical protein